MLLLGFGVLCIGTFRETVSPYPRVPEMRATSRIVQVYGAIDQTRLHCDGGDASLVFTLTDSGGQTMQVRYRGPRPGNMAQATHCVATGRWLGDHFRGHPAAR